DPESRHSRKNRHTPVDGYRAHLAAGPGTGIITDEDLTMACGPGCSDADAAARFLASEHEQDERGQQDGAGPDAAAVGGGGPGQDTGSGHLTWYADSAYGTGELGAVIAAAGDAAVIKPKTPRPHVERTVAQVATSRGRRLKLRYRGTAKNKAWLKTRTAAVNLATLLRHDLTRAGRTWTAAPATG